MLTILIQKTKLYQLHSEGIKGRKKVLWKRIPAMNKLKKIIHEEFSLNLTKKILDTVMQSIKAFETKGKTIIRKEILKAGQDIEKPDFGRK